MKSSLYRNQSARKELANTPPIHAGSETGNLHSSDLQLSELRLRELDNPVWASNSLRVLEWVPVNQRHSTDGLAVKLLSRLNAAKGESWLAVRHHVLSHTIFLVLIPRTLLQMRNVHMESVLLNKAPSTCFCRETL